MKQARGRGVAAASVLAFLPLITPAALADDTVGVVLPALPRGKSVVVRFSATVVTPFPEGRDSVSTQGTVTGINFSPVLTDDPDAPGMSDPTITPIVAAPDLAISKTDGLTAVAPGSMTVYTLSVLNLGNQSATTVRVLETVPADTTFNAALSSPGWSCADGSPAPTACEFALGTLAPSATPVTVLFAVNVSATPAGASIVNTATVVDDGQNGPDGDLGNNSATDTNTLDGPVADLAITKTNNRSQVVAGAVTTYTITVTNDGPDGIVGARVTDTPPAVLTGATWTCAPSAGAACTASGTGAIDDLADIPAGASVVYTLKATLDVDATGTVVNTAAVAVPLGSADPDTADNSATDTDAIVQRPAVSDFNGDGKTDIVLFNTVTGAVQEWWMDGTTIDTTVFFAPQANPTARIVGTGDYDGNGQSDLLWQDQVTFAVETWMNGTLSGPALPPPPALYPVVSTGDYDGNGVSDILWLDGATRQLTVWLMSGGTVMTSQVVGTIGPNRDVRASDDFNNDGRSDLLMQNRVDLSVQVRFMDGVSPFVQQGTGQVGWPAFAVEGTGYYGSDPYADVVWHRPGAEVAELWTMNGATVESRVMPDQNLRGGGEVVGTGDYDGDGNADLLWQADFTDGLRIWLMDGAHVTSRARLGKLPSPDSEWVVAGQVR